MAEIKQDFKMQELHMPSAFEGVLWTTMGIRDGITVFHAPPGCYINQHMNALVNDWSAEMYSTNLSYGDVMQGAEKQLESVLRKVIARGPKAIFIVTAPSVEVTHDDVEGVAQNVGFKDTVIIRPPIGGTAGEGKDTAFRALLDLMEPAPQKQPRSINIIGPTYSTFNWRADVFELSRMLAGIGVEVNCVLSAGATVQELKQALRAALNVCIYPYDCGVATAMEMQKRFGLPYMDDIIPVGFANSAAWLEKIAGFFGIDARPYLQKTIANCFEFICANMVFAVTFEMTAALSLENNNTYAVGISEFLAQEAGVQVLMCSVSSAAAAQRLSATCGEILISPTIEQKRDAFVQSAAMVIYGNFYDKKVSMDEGFKNFIFADIPTIGYLNTENRPFMGFMGAKYLVESLVNEVYMGIFLETKGEMMGPISTGAVPWDEAAQQAMIKIAEMMPHFVRATATKKLHQVAEQYAKERSTTVTLAIIQEVADKFTPTKFKAQFSSVFDEVPQGGSGQAEDEEVPIERLNFSMPWEDEAKKMLEFVPSPFRQEAVSGTEQYAREHSSAAVTVTLMEEFRKELGM